MNLEQILEYAEGRGLRVANLFQFRSGEVLYWRANVTDEGKVWEFATARDPAQALLGAISNALQGVGEAPFPEEREARGEGPMAAKESSKSAEDLGL